MGKTMILNGLALSCALAILSSCGPTYPVVVSLQDLGLPADNSPARKIPGVPHEFVYAGHKAGNEKHVSDVKQLQSAISNAKPGDVITLQSGLYLADQQIVLNANGTASNPITIRAADSRQTEIRFSELNGYVEGFIVFGKHWIIDGFVLSAACVPKKHDQCEHAIHIKSGAEGLIVRNNEIINFNAAIKGGGSNNTYANNVRIEHNEIFNTEVRMTTNPVTPIDVNGGDGWVLYKNSIYDFAKGIGNQVSYGAFFKANSSNGVMDSNWLQCQKNVVAPGARVGLSLGGGGNFPIDSPVCTNSDCSHLHRNGQITNNVITNCTDVGIYVNASSDSLVKNNTLLSTTGIDIRYETSTARIVSNILVGGDVTERDGGRVLSNNANVLRQNVDKRSMKKLLNAKENRSTNEPQLKYDICGFNRTTPIAGAAGGTAKQREACMTQFQ